MSRFKVGARVHLSAVPESERNLQGTVVAVGPVAGLGEPFCYIEWDTSQRSTRLERSAATYNEFGRDSCQWSEKHLREISVIDQLADLVGEVTNEDCP